LACRDHRADEIARLTRAVRGRDHRCAAARREAAFAGIAALTGSSAPGFIRLPHAAARAFPSSLRRPLYTIRLVQAYESLVFRKHVKLCLTTTTAFSVAVRRRQRTLPTVSQRRRESMTCCTKSVSKPPSFAKLPTHQSLRGRETAYARIHERPVSAYDTLASRPNPSSSTPAYLRSSNPASSSNRLRASNARRTKKKLRVERLRLPCGNRKTSETRARPRVIEGNSSQHGKISSFPFRSSQQRTAGNRRNAACRLAPRSPAPEILGANQTRVGDAERRRRRAIRARENTRVTRSRVPGMHFPSLEASSSGGVSGSAWPTPIRNRSDIVPGHDEHFLGERRLLRGHDQKVSTCGVG